jgi:hypothetical protein
MNPLKSPLNALLLGLEYTFNHRDKAGMTMTLLVEKLYGHSSYPRVVHVGVQ